MSPFKIKNLLVEKEAAIVDQEVWVFAVNGTNPQDLVSAVKVASYYYGISPSVILTDIYAKNLNIERENSMGDQALSWRRRETILLRLRLHIFRLLILDSGVLQPVLVSK